jgi:hypothetical protein
MIRFNSNKITANIFKMKRHKHKHKNKNILISTNPKNQTQKMITWLTSGIFIFLILVSMVGLIYKDYKEKITKEIMKEIARQENSQRLSVDLPHSSDIASDWKAYQNNQYGFSLKYPEAWGYTEEVPSDLASKYKAKVAFRYKPGINLDMKGLDIYIYEGEEFSDPVNTNNIIRKNLKANPELCSFSNDVTIGEENYPAKETYILNNNICYKNAYFYSLTKDKYTFNIVPLPAKGFNALNYDGKREIGLYFPEFFNILSTFSFKTETANKVVIPHRVYVAKASCAEKNDHPSKSKQGKGLHIDEDCCIDPDEWPNPRCAYSAKAMDIAHAPPTSKKK